MTIASRTPEGFPSECPLCGASTNLEYSNPGQDAPCPQCGHLLLFSANALLKLQRFLSETHGIAIERITRDFSFTERGSDSLDVVEMVMELEEEYDINISDADAEDIRTVGDAIRYLERRRRNM